MRSPRSVTLQPMARPSRSLNEAIDLRDLQISGFWPVILVMSPTAASITLRSATASPTPMLTVILVIFGTSMGLASCKSALSLGTTVSR